MSKVVGAAIKPKERSWSPRHLPTNVHYGWMKQQVKQGGAAPGKGLLPEMLWLEAPSVATLCPQSPPVAVRGNNFLLTGF